MARRRIPPIALSSLAVLLATGLAPAGAHADDTAPPPPRTVSAWLPYWDQDAAYRDALAHAAQLRTISPFWYETKSATRVAGHPGAGERRIIDGLHAKDIQVVPTVMEQLKPGALAAVLTSPARRADHVEALLAVVRSRSYDGLDIDYETIAPTPDADYRAVRDGYATFVTDLCARLHALNKQCFVSVTPKTPTSGRIWDYERIGAAVDRMRIMGYNLHYAEGGPGPLSSPEWYDRILDTATAQVPRAKLEMGIPAYGWDWDADGKKPSKHVTWKEADALRRKEKAPYTLDPGSGTPYFTYRDGATRRTVWYQDARGIAAHLPALRSHGVPDTVLWALGFEDPQLWKVLANG
ncbi:glycosyl hydrolase family 18 protein [Streptomyces sp. VRA16 Mangrove soil]|uniref:glycosyl hydrolase family 18 protein n=1 Tax=Streptomyces sp. VRA16 Mangrove soil TaxID=2817434 RepID=UPI001A9F8563|nr:glycosyl hydrolase family 18 protein [Streptomyces sp. VRA16 Mangrove soil]MBO1334571.1 glycosyl hydrolase [Streptomyces sp. VRA16 Mangrove soil]